MKKLIQTEIGKRCGIHQATISNILTGRRRPSWSTAKKIAEATGSDPVDWMESPPETLRQIIQRINEQRIDNDMQ